VYIVFSELFPAFTTRFFTPLPVPSSVKRAQAGRSIRARAAVMHHNLFLFILIASIISEIEAPALKKKESHGSVIHTQKPD